MLDGKRALVMGLANDRSIAWGVATALREAGCEIATTYPNSAIEKRMRPLSEQLGAKLITACDVSEPQSIDDLAKTVADHWPEGFDILVHSLAFAEKSDLENPFVETSKEGFLKAMDISAYSLVAVSKALAPLLAKRPESSIVTMTYYGSQKVMGNYNVMGVAKAALEAAVRYLASNLGPQGIRVNAVSAGPIKTLAASGVKGLRESLDKVEKIAPLPRKLTIEDVGASTMFLCSPGSRAITGHILYVDNGFNILGAGATEST